MKSQIITTAAIIGLLLAVSAGDLFAAGKGNGGYGKQNGTCVNGQSAAGGAVTRPEGSQRRDGTFLTTGVTANGSTVRPGYGKGLQDGSRLAAPAPVSSVTP